MANDSFKSAEAFAVSLLVGLWFTFIGGYELINIYKGADTNPIGPGITFLGGIISLLVMARYVEAAGEGPRNQGSIYDL